MGFAMFANSIKGVTILKNWRTYKNNGGGSYTTEAYAKSQTRGYESRAWQAGCNLTAYETKKQYKYSDWKPYDVYAYTGQKTWSDVIRGYHSRKA